jgi:hypothetical protein
MTTELLDERDAAQFCGIDLTAFRNLRRTGKGPQFNRPSPRKAFYRLDDLEAWTTSLNLSPIYRKAYLTIHGLPRQGVLSDRRPDMVFAIVKDAYYEEAQRLAGEFDSEFLHFVGEVFKLCNPPEGVESEDRYKGNWLIYADEEEVAYCCLNPKCLNGKDRPECVFYCEPWSDY